MRRRARGREFRSNFHLNGTVEPVEIDDDFRRVALEAAKVMGLNIAGVDLLESHHGPLVLEVNSSPGLEGIERSTKVNVAAHIARFVMDAHAENSHVLSNQYTQDMGLNAAENDKASGQFI